MAAYAELPLPLRERAGVRGMADHASGRARALRRTQTTAESVLWRHLRNRQLNGRKWRRQQPIDQYVVDFFCAELRLVVEVDGDVHAFTERRDAAREAYLKGQGLQVARFTNDDVLKNLEGVLTRLWELSS